jgi:hypothetical protein
LAHYRKPDSSDQLSTAKEKIHRPVTDHPNTPEFYVSY